MRTASAIELTEEERATLVALSRGKKVSVRLAQRSAIAACLEITRQKAARWRDRYATQGIKGVEMDASPDFLCQQKEGDPKNPPGKACGGHPVESQHHGGGQRVERFDDWLDLEGARFEAAFEPHIQALQRQAVCGKARSHRGALPEPSGTGGGVFLQ